MPWGYTTGVLRALQPQSGFRTSQSLHSRLAPKYVIFVRVLTPSAPEGENLALIPPQAGEVDLARIELATLSCEDSGMPLTYRPGIFSEKFPGKPETILVFYFKNDRGSTGTPPRRTSKCRCVPVERPLLPIRPITWPLPTLSPGFT